MFVLATKKARRTAILAFADAHILKNLEGFLQFGGFLCVVIRRR